MGLFKRKPGGTLVGNLLRGVAKTAANTFVPGLGAVVGNGAMMISQEDADKRDLSDADYIKKYGVAKDGKPVSVVPALAQMTGAVLAGGVGALPNGPVSATSNDFATNAQLGAQSAGKNIFQRFGGYIAAGVAGLILILVLIFKRK